MNMISISTENSNVNNNNKYNKNTKNILSDSLNITE